MRVWYLERFQQLLGVCLALQHGLPMAFQTITRLTFGTTAGLAAALLASYATRLLFFEPGM